MFVCVCNAVTDHEIRDHAARGVECLDQLRAINGCSDCCGQCADEAEAILHSARLSVTAPMAVLPVRKSA